MENKDNSPKLESEDYKEKRVCSECSEYKREICKTSGNFRICPQYQESNAEMKKLGKTFRKLKEKGR